MNQRLNQGREEHPYRNIHTEIGNDLMNDMKNFRKGFVDGIYLLLDSPVRIYNFLSQSKKKLLERISH